MVTKFVIVSCDRSATRVLSSGDVNAKIIGNLKTLTIGEKQKVLEGVKRKKKDKGTVYNHASVIVWCAMRYCAITLT